MKSTPAQKPAVPSPRWIYGSKDTTEEDVLTFVKRTFLDRTNEYQVIVGTDSHVEGQNFRFVTIVCVYTVGKGGDFYRLVSYEPRANFMATGNAGTEVGNKRRKHNHKLRMFNEVAKSIEIQDWIRDKTGIVSETHIDASKPGTKHFTSAFSTELVGYANASGYEAKLKPEAFVANAVADKFTK